jgi:hypothetical protein
MAGTVVVMTGMAGPGLREPYPILNEGGEAQKDVPGPVLHPRISRMSSAESTRVTSNEPRHPRRLEKKKNTEELRRSLL